MGFPYGDGLYGKGLYSRRPDAWRPRDCKPPPWIGESCGPSPWSALTLPPPDGWSPSPQQSTRARPWLRTR